MREAIRIEPDSDDPATSDDHPTLMPVEPPIHAIIARFFDVSTRDLASVLRARLLDERRPDLAGRIATLLDAHLRENPR